MRTQEFIAAATAGQLARVNPRKNVARAGSDAWDFSQMSLRELARHCCARNGLPQGESSSKMVARALSTSDFPAILENIAVKSLRDAYELAPRTFVLLGRQTGMPDYREVSRPQFSDAPKLDRVLEGGEYTYGTVGDQGEKYRLFKYGKVVSISREAIVNDDLNALGRLPAMMGAAAAQLESSLFWSTITGNQTMSDGNALFSAEHNNLEASGSVIDIASIGDGRAAMHRQQTEQGHFLHASPAFLVVPTAIETRAEQFVSPSVIASEPGAINPFAGRLQVVSEPRLDTASATAWYLWADPNMIDTVEYAFLQGEEGPQIQRRENFNTDGLDLKVRHSFAARAIDWRGMFRNDGA